MKYFIYWNLHKDVYSLRGRHGRVVCHAVAVHIHDAQFRVGQKGRERVLESGHKNVHAGVSGEGHALTRQPPSKQYADFVRVTYNPRKYSTFVTVTGERPVICADEVWMVIEEGKPRLYAHGLVYEKQHAA